MKHLVSVAAFAASANALVGRADSCCFKLTASGGASGTLGQLGDGQNRIGDSSLPPATYCIDSKGGITDASGRGCILTPPTTQFQCDQGATPTPGFSINSQGQLEYKGSTSFVACETGQNGGMNIYTTNSEDITQCTKVTLSADSCAGSGAGGGAPSGPSAGASSAPGVSASSVPGGGAGGAPGASPSSMPGAGTSVPGGGAGGIPGASPSSMPGGGASSAPGGGAGGFPSASPSGPMGSASGSASTGIVSVMTPGSSSPGAGGAGGGPMTQSPGPESSPGGAGGMGGGAVKTTIVKTQTVAVCPQTSSPGAGGAGGVPSGPGAGGVGGGAPSSTPSVPGAGGAGGAPTGPSGGGAGGVPSGPGAGGAPSGTPSGPGAGGAPSGSPSGPGAGGAPSGPSGGAQPSGPSGGGAGGGPSGPGAGGQPSGTPSAPGGGAQPSGTAAGGASCPTNLSGDYEYPHLIIPVDSSAPSKAPGTSFNGTVTDTVSSIFNFDIPKSDSGKTCSLVFLFPEQQDLETSAFSFSGNGKVDVAMLSGDATSKTSYSNKPSVKKDYGEFTISPGNSYLISTFKCPAGETVSYEMSNAGTTNLDYFQDYNPSPLGMYITVC